MTTTMMKMRKREKEMLTASILKNKRKFSHPVLGVADITDRYVLILTERFNEFGVAKGICYEHHGSVEFSKLDNPHGPVTLTPISTAEFRRRKSKPPRKTGDGVTLH